MFFALSITLLLSHNKRRLNVKNQYSLLVLVSIIVIEFVSCSCPQEIPPRPDEALTGSQVSEIISSMPLEEREEAIYKEISSGNIPDFLRTFKPVHLKMEIHNKNISATYYVSPDYLAIGSDNDYFLMPMTPKLAQKCADFMGCSLPTTKMVDDIYKSADLKLLPEPIPPSPKMTTVPVFYKHNELVKKQRDIYLQKNPLGDLVAGHKKDIVITNKLYNPEFTKNVAIYGWHKPDGKPIQPLYSKHVDWWADYSHGVRLISNNMEVNGKKMLVSEVLSDPNLAELLSYEGVIPVSRYPKTGFSPIPTPVAEQIK